MRPRESTTPVARFVMELSREYRYILYTDRCGDSGRSVIDGRLRGLEVDAASFALPVAEARGLGTGRSADLARATRLRGGGRGTGKRVGGRNGSRRRGVLL